MVSPGPLRLVWLLLGTAVAMPVIGIGQSAETWDHVSEDIDLIRQLDQYKLTVDQLKAIRELFQPLETARKALRDYKASDVGIGPLLALRDALLKGEDTDAQEAAVQAVWDKLEELDNAIEEAATEAAKKLAALLTDEQLASLSGGDDLAYNQADEIFSNLETAREFSDETFAAWRDRTAREVAFRAAGESEEKGKQIQEKVRAFLDRTRKLSEQEYLEKSDELFEELTTILAEAQPKPIREIAVARAAEQLEYLVRSERAPSVVEALINARGG